MKAYLLLLAILLLPSAAIAQQSPAFSGPAITFDYGSCTNTTGTTCTATTINTYGSSAVCQATDEATTDPVNAVCSVSGNTVTVTNGPTIIGRTCATSATTSCTATAPYAVSSALRCVAGATAVTTAYAHCTQSATTITVTLSSSATDTWQILDLLVVPTATGHVFQFQVWQ